jgi:hypothetical protein
MRQEKKIYLLYKTLVRRLSTCTCGSTTAEPAGKYRKEVQILVNSKRNYINIWHEGIQAEFSHF